jgi:hypothetical protein
MCEVAWEDNKYCQPTLIAWLDLLEWVVREKEQGKGRGIKQKEIEIGMDDNPGSRESKCLVDGAISAFSSLQ